MRLLCIDCAVEQPIPKQVVSAGESVTLSIVTEGTHEYKWQFSQDGVISWQDVSGPRFDGIDQSVLQLRNVQKSDRCFYRCKIYNAKEILVTELSALIVG